MHEGGWPVWKLKLYIVKSMQAAWCPVWEFKVKISNIHEKEHPCTQHKCFGLFSFQNKMKWFWAKNWIFIKLKYFRALQLWCQRRTYVSEFQWISNFCSPLDSKLKNGRGGGGTCGNSPPPSTSGCFLHLLLRIFVQSLRRLWMSGTKDFQHNFK